MKTFSEYEEAADRTARYPGRTEDGNLGILYTVLGLNGESGEVAEQVKKALRDDSGVITNTRREALKKELGDVLWYLARCAYECGLTLEEVAEANIQKLDDRARRGVLGGSGDER